jgi:hypothetical protein
LDLLSDRSLYEQRKAASGAGTLLYEVRQGRSVIRGSIPVGLHKSLVPSDPLVLPALVGDVDGEYHERERSHTKQHGAEEDDEWHVARR